MDSIKIKNENGRKKKHHKAKETFEEYGCNTTRGARIKQQTKEKTTKNQTQASDKK